MRWAFAAVGVGRRGLNDSEATLPAAAPGDEELVQRVRLGDATAFRAIVDRYADRWHGLAYRMLGRRDLAEDVVQDVFLRLWSRPDSFHAFGARFSTWSYRVVVNRCLDRLKAKHVTTSTDEIDPADPAPDQLSQLIAAEGERRLAMEIGKLPARQRAALVLVYTAGLSNKDAARVMDVSVKAFETLLVRAKRNLRAAMAHDAGEQG